MSVPFTPRPYQVIARDFILDTQRCNLWAVPGMGKTASIYSVLDILQMCGSSFFPCLVLAPKRVCELTWPAERDKWTDFNGLRIASIIGEADVRDDALMAKADVYFINYDNIQWLMQRVGKRWPFKIVVADECFTAGTPVAVPGGTAPIESLKVGDKICTHAGVRRVTRAFTKETESFNLVSLTFTDGTVLHATKHHPFFTDLGWLPAEACQGRRVYRLDQVSYMRRQIRAGSGPCAMESEARQDSVLLAILSHERDIREESRAAENVVEEYARASQDDGDDVEQRYSVVSGETRGDVCASNCAGTASSAGRQRPHRTDGGADSAFDAAGFYLELRSTVGERWARISKSLQAGLWRPCAQGVSGGGWELPPYSDWQSARRKEDCTVTVARVESYQDQERRSLVPIFNIEVESAPTYFASGLLTHNSTRLKNFRIVKGGKRAAALAEIARSVGRWINLTGTPAPNGAKDLWGQNWFVDFGARLGTSYEKFMRRWYYVNPYSRTCELRHESCFDEIKALLADVALALRAEDWFPVQKPIYTPIEVVLPDAARAVYDQMERDFYAELDSGAVTAANSAVKSLKLLQIASGAVYDADKKAHWLHDAKIEALRSLIDELAGEPLLVAYWFKFEPDMLRAAFPEMRVFKTKKDEADWNKGAIPLMAIHPASAGHGTNLQYGGRAMAHFTHTWDLELRQQVEERIGPVRQLQAGLNRNVIHYNLIARDTIDRTVLDRQTSKASVQESLMLARAHRPQ